MTTACQHKTSQTVQTVMTLSRHTRLLMWTTAVNHQIDFVSRVLRSPTPLVGPLNAYTTEQQPLTCVAENTPSFFQRTPFKARPLTEYYICIASIIVIVQHRHRKCRPIHRYIQLKVRTPHHRLVSHLPILRFITCVYIGIHLIAAQPRITLCIEHGNLLVHLLQAHRDSLPHGPFSSSLSLVLGIFFHFA